MRVSRAVLLVACAALIGCAPQPEEDLEVASDVAARRAKFVPQTIAVEVGHLSDGDRRTLRHLVAAARVVDEVFRLQAWVHNPEFAQRVAALDGPDAAAAQDYYRIRYGKWDRIEELEPFLGEEEHPAGAGFYPESMTKEEFDAWLAEHPEDAESFRSLHTIVRRDAGRLVAVPYSGLRPEGP